jgi:hypothetical protein
MDRRALACFWIALGVSACGAASPGREAGSRPPAIQSIAPAAPTAPTAPAGGESVACRASRGSILAAMQASRERGVCASDADCAVVTGPGHPLPDYRQVVHGADAAALDARASEHLRVCGAFHRHEEIGVYTTVEARCVAARCAAVETGYHTDEGP